MRSAIDRIKIGTEQEVSADFFYGKVIQRRLSRFFCPECGEKVYWRSKGGSQPNQFYHPVKTELSPECDKRVDGRSNLYVYERVGLSTFLTRSGDSFRLNIGFPAIGADALQRAATQGIKIKILVSDSVSERSRVISVNQTNFFSDATTLVPIDFVPEHEKNYTIAVEGSGWNTRKWADYSDGFARAGAIFSFDEFGGKKIRRGDSISLSKKYYVVTKKLVSFYSEVVYTLVGTIQLNNEQYQVYTMTVSVDSSNELRYGIIDGYFRDYYGVWLIETSPEIIPLWPPVIERDVFIPVVRKNMIYCSAISGNSAPAVYFYDSSNVDTLAVSMDKLKNYSIKLPIISSGIAVSVDRKYVGREVVFQYKSLVGHNHQYMVSLYRPEGDALDFNNLLISDLNSGIMVKSNAKMDLILCGSDHVYKQIPLRCSNIKIEPISGIHSILFTIENHIMMVSRVAASRMHNGNEEELLLQIIYQNLRGIPVPVPYWVRLLLSRWHDQRCQNAVALVERSIVNGKAPAGLIRVLATILAK